MAGQTAETRMIATTVKGKQSSPKKSVGKLRGGEGILHLLNKRVMLPRYTAILSRTEEDGVGMEDLDALQLELEGLLSAVVVRSRVLQEEIAALSSAEERRGDSKKVRPGPGRPATAPTVPAVVAPLSPGKRERPLKKLKESSKSQHAIGKVREHEPAEHPRHDAPKVVLPKNDTPNKFWLSVEPYCCDITNEDLKLLDDLIAEYDRNSEYYKIPALGRHYSLRWAQEDLLDEQDNGSGQSARAAGRMRTQSADVATGMLKRVEQRAASTEGTTGPLTQRLISALMEENIMVPVQDSFESPAKRCRGAENTTPRSGGMFRSFAISSSASLERRIRKELEEQGILDMTEHKDTADDEILAELKRCQAELKVISSHNQQQLRRLRKLASEEMTRQELKRQLAQADQEVLEVYRRITASKQKKRPPTKREIDQAWKALRDRETLLKQIDSQQPQSHSQQMQQ